eukprot:7378984-Karenia_brevis.AAC.1
MPSDGLVAGAPCIPWAGNGQKLGEGDARFNPMLSVLVMVVTLAKHGMLLFVLLENVFGTLQWTGASPPIFKRILLVLQKEVPEFWWGLDKMFAQYYMLGASRRRVFLKGVIKSKVSVPAVPPPLPPLGKGNLRQHMTLGMPCLTTADLTKQQWGNLKSVIAKIKQEKSIGNIPAGALVVIAADRADGKVYSQQWQ